MNQSPIKTIAEFEAKVDLPANQVHKLLGVAYVTYAQYRIAKRPLPTYIRRMMQTLCLLNKAQLNALIREHVYAQKDKSEH